MDVNGSEATDRRISGSSELERWLVAGRCHWVDGAATYLAMSRAIEERDVLSPKVPTLGRSPERIRLT